MMVASLDIALVILTVAAAAIYLIVRKLRALRAVQRDWSSGHAASCGSCPALQLKRHQKFRVF